MRKALMAILLRTLLFLLPLLAFFLIMKYRLSGDKSEEALAAETASLKRILILIAIAFGGLALLLNFISVQGSPNQCYIAPKSQDGQIIAGRYVDPDDPACLAAKSPKFPQNAPQSKDPASQSGG